MPPPENPFAARDHGHFERLAPEVLLWRNIVNSTVVVGRRGVAVIDTQVNAALARRLREAIAREIGKPILYAINTHYHWDHTNGNAVFHEAGATIVASERTARAMVERAPRQKDFLASRGFELGDDPVAPQLRFADHHSLDLGDVALELSHGKDAETADPTLVWMPQARILASGDTVMTGSFPIFGQPSQREGLENDAWLAALAEIRALDAAVVCPGHGPAARAPELALLERLMRYFLDTVRAHHRAGRTLTETIQVMEEEMPAWITRIPQVWGTPRYAILRVWAGLADLGEPGWQHVKPSAIPRAEPAPALPPAWAEAVAHAIEGGDPAQAVALAEAATRAHPQEPAAWTLVAQAFIRASRDLPSVLEKGDCFQAARTALRQALTLDPDYAPALLAQGQYRVMMAFRNGDDPTPGEALLERAAASPALSPRQRAEVAFYRGIAARARGQEEEAVNRFRAALRDDPSFRPALIASMR